MAELNPLQELQASQGARFIDMEERSIAAAFGSSQEAIASAKTGVALHDRSHWGRIEVSDGDRLRFLHNQSTNDFLTLQPGQGCETVFVTSTARTLDLVTAYIQPDSVLLLTHPSCRNSLIKWMDRFIFFADKVKLTNRTDETAMFGLIGPESLALLNRLGLDIHVDSPHHHQTVTIDGSEVLVAVGSGLAIPGYTLITSASQAAAVWQRLSESGAVPLGEDAWEQLRIQQGRPIPGAELTEEYNPLEAGLWQAVSFEKGCYIGQETIARLDTYNGVKQQLWGIQLPAAVDPGTPLIMDEKKVGTLTSIVEQDQGVIGLAYVRTKAGGEGLTVQVGEVSGTVVQVPFLTRSRQDKVDES